MNSRAVIANVPGSTAGLRESLELFADAVGQALDQLAGEDREQ